MKGFIDRDDHKSLRRDLKDLGLDGHRARSFAGMIASKAPGTADNLIVGLTRLGFVVVDTTNVAEGDVFRDVVVSRNGRALRLVF